MFNQQELFIGLTIFIAFIVSSVLAVFSGLQAAILGAGIVIALAIAYGYPRLGLWAFLIYLPFGGTISYGIGSVYQAVGGEVTYNNSIYALFHLAKDAFYFPALLAIFISGFGFNWFKKPERKPLVLTILVLLGFCLLTMLFVNLPQELEAQRGSPLLMAVMGLKVWLGYIPLIICADYLIRDKQDLSLLMRLTVILILICCGLCLMQYLLLVNGICEGSSNLPEPANNRASLQARCFVGGSLLYNPKWGLIRLPGTFVSPWQWGWFLIASIFFAFGGSVSESSRNWKIVSWGAIAFILIISLLSGQRISLLLVPIIFLVLLFVTETNKKILGIKLGIITFLAMIASSLGIVQERVSNFIARWNYAPPTGFILKEYKRVLNSFELLGNGLGTTASAVRRLGKIELIEVFHGKLLYEIGLGGLLAFIAVVSVLTWLTFKAYQQIKDKSLRRLGICLWVFVLFISYNIYYYPLVVDPVAVYYWFFAGVLLKLPEICNKS